MGNPHRHISLGQQMSREETMKDCRGTNRGKCKNCAHCTEYSSPVEGTKCTVCSCPPAKHQNMDSGVDLATPPPTTEAWTDSCSDGAIQSLSRDMDSIMPSLSLASTCSVPGCSQAVGFDINTGLEHVYCNQHNMYQSGDAGLQVEDIELDSDHPNSMMYTQDQMMSLQTAQIHQNVYDGSVSGDMSLATPSLPVDQAGLPQAMSLPPGVKKCAIQECSNPCYVDDSGIVHECCGYTHAMEHQRRQALWQQVNQQIVKGVTHCFLPECNRPTWPFQNYCGRTHADQGKQRGLSPPSLSTYSGQQAATSGPKDNTMCIIPECYKKKYVDTTSGVTHDYCGKTHAQEGAVRGIRPTADKTEEQCELPGCTNRKRTEGQRVHDYCCLDHAQQDAPNRDARILTSDSQVQSFLKQFSSLNVISRIENVHAKPGGALFQRFKQAYDSLPKAQRQTCLAFHGTAVSNIDSICQNGYDPKLRKGQAYGAGEYFAKSPSTSMGYCSGKKMLLNELLLGQSGTHHTQHGDIIVMKNPDHDLPRYVITFS